MLLERVFKTLLVFVLCGWVASCTKSPSSQVQLKLYSKNSAFYDYQVQALSFQVSNDKGVKKSRWIPCGTGDCSSIEIELPRDGKYLFQVALIAKGDFGATVYLYGEVSQDLSLEENVNLPIGVSVFGTHLSDTVKWTGKYKPRIGHPLHGRTLTGNLRVAIHPEGRPPVVITQSEIFQGWFSTFLFRPSAQSARGLAFEFTGWDDKLNVIEKQWIFDDLVDTGRFGVNSETVAIQPKVSERFTLDTPYTEAFCGGANPSPNCIMSFRKVYGGFYGVIPENRSMCYQNYSGVYDGLSTPRRICRGDQTFCTPFAADDFVLAPSDALVGAETVPLCDPTLGDDDYVQVIHRSKVGTGDDFVGRRGLFRSFMGWSLGETGTLRWGRFDSEKFYWKPDENPVVSGFEVFFGETVEEIDWAPFRGIGKHVSCEKLVKSDQFTSVYSGSESSFEYVGKLPAGLLITQVPIVICAKDPKGQYFQFSAHMQGVR